jgi:hypothetical protein
VVAAEEVVGQLREPLVAGLRVTTLLPQRGSGFFHGLNSVISPASTPDSP